MGKPGDVYCPSNGSEGTGFVEEYCMACQKCNPDPTKLPQCDILAASMAYSYKDERFPKEWTYTEAGQPTCTARIAWDWENDGHPDDSSGKAYIMPKNENQEELKL